MNSLFEKITIKEQMLKGKAVKHTIEEDQNQSIVNKLIEQVKNVTKTGVVYLVQMYDDAYLDTEELISFVGSTDIAGVEYSSLLIPENNYMRTTTDSSNIDDAYQASYQYFSDSQIQIASNYDFEIINLKNNEIHVHFPLINNLVDIPNYSKSLDSKNEL